MSGHLKLVSSGVKKIYIKNKKEKKIDKSKCKW